jgi:hypothetical protein
VDNILISKRHVDENPKVQSAIQISRESLFAYSEFNLRKIHEDLLNPNTTPQDIENFIALLFNSLHAWGKNSEVDEIVKRRFPFERSIVAGIGFSG